MQPVAQFWGDPHQIQRVYPHDRQERVRALTHVLPGGVGEKTRNEDVARLVENGDAQRLQVVWSTWSMPHLTEAHLAHFPDLQIVFYAAGSVQGFARPFLARGIQVISAWQANAVPVAEFTLAQILLANKGYWQDTAPIVSASGYQAARHNRVLPGNFETPVVLLGAGAVGRLVIELLRPFRLCVLVWDKFLTYDGAKSLGVEKVETLAEAFARGQVVSNHLANNDQTAGLLTGKLFAQMRPSATFINTGRGRTVDEAGLISVLQSRPDLTALLDVTHPEPPEDASPLYRLPNVHLTSHIAGSVGSEVVRMADYCLDECERWLRGEPLRYAVTPEMLETMA
jgi:phosphoglycerate dehydrogenase-like enzyme